MSSTLAAEPAAPSAPRPFLTPARLARLALKELRETLRDRRTILTLILMPILVYPLLSLAFRQVVLTSVQPGHVRVRIGVASEEQRHYVAQIMELGDQLLAEPP